MWNIIIIVDKLEDWISSFVVDNIRLCHFKYVYGCRLFISLLMNIRCGLLSLLLTKCEDWISSFVVDSIRLCHFKYAYVGDHYHQPCSYIVYCMVCISIKDVCVCWMHFFYDYNLIYVFHYICRREWLVRGFWFRRSIIRKVIDLYEWSKRILF